MLQSYYKNWTKQDFQQIKYAHQQNYQCSTYIVENSNISFEHFNFICETHFVIKPKLLDVLIAIAPSSLKQYNRPCLFSSAFLNSAIDALVIKIKQTSRILSLSGYMYDSLNELTDIEKNRAETKIREIAVKYTMLLQPSGDSCRGGDVAFHLIDLWSD